MYCSLTSFNGFSRSVVITKCNYSAEIFLGRFGQPESDLIGRERVAGLGWMVVRYRGSSSNFRIVQTTAAVGSETEVRSAAKLKVGLG